MISFQVLGYDQRDQRCVRKSCFSLLSVNYINPVNKWSRFLVQFYLSSSVAINLLLILYDVTVSIKLLTIILILIMTISLTSYSIFALT